MGLKELTLKEEKEIDLGTNNLTFHPETGCLVGVRFGTSNQHWREGFFIDHRDPYSLEIVRTDDINCRVSSNVPTISFSSNENLFSISREGWEPRFFSCKKPFEEQELSSSYSDVLRGARESYHFVFGPSKKQQIIFAAFHDEQFAIGNLSKREQITGDKMNWDFGSGWKRVELPGPISSLAFSPDGRQIATGSYGL